MMTIEEFKEKLFQENEQRWNDLRREQEEREAQEAAAREALSNAEDRVARAEAELNEAKSALAELRPSVDVTEV